MTKHPTNLPVGRPKGVTSFQSRVAKAFGEVIRKARVEQGISQEELGFKAGMPRNHVGNIERGENAPTISHLVKLAEGLNVTAASLIAEMEKLLLDSLKQ